MSNKPMSKTQLLAALADAMGADKKTASTALDALVAVVAREVANGGAVTLPGLGKIACRERPERDVRSAGGLFVRAHRVGQCGQKLGLAHRFVGHVHPLVSPFAGLLLAGFSGQCPSLQHSFRQ